MFEVSDEEFEEAISRGIESIPERFRRDIENVVFVAQDEPNASQLALINRGDSLHRELLGLYSGVSRTRRGAYYGAGSAVPDVITVFQGPHQRIANSREQLFENVRRTVVHEVGHYFGMDEEQLREMGYGST